MTSFSLMYSMPIQPVSGFGRIAGDPSQRSVTRNTEKSTNRACAQA